MKTRMECLRDKRSRLTIRPFIQTPCLVVGHQLLHHLNNNNRRNNNHNNNRYTQTPLRMITAVFYYCDKYFALSERCRPRLSAHHRILLEPRDDNKRRDGSRPPWADRWTIYSRVCTTVPSLCAVLCLCLSEKKNGETAEINVILFLTTRQPTRSGSRSALSRLTTGD